MDFIKIIMNKKQEISELKRAFILCMSLQKANH